MKRICLIGSGNVAEAFAVALGGLLPPEDSASDRFTPGTGPAERNLPGWRDATIRTIRHSLSRQIST